MSESDTVIGVISDTHGLLRPEAIVHLAGSSQIIHAGDVGDYEIIERLEKIAPVTAVLGNTDYREKLPGITYTELLEVGSVFFYVLHILEEIDLDPQASGIKVVIYGHTHLPKAETEGGVLYLNPGSAGPARRGTPISLARLTIRSGELIPEFIELEG